ncbi:MAG: hypothetical protein Q7T19_11240 [Caulobacter sp.]|nr:hypothetical protein [Caulobacter sp.]
MTVLKSPLLIREVTPFALALFMLLAATLATDGLLHLLNAVWIGRWLGIPGVLLIAGSFGYSLRKHRIINSGRPMTLLRLHERMAWAGSLLILVHAGVHFNAVLAWLAVGAMVLNIGSGLTGKFLLKNAKARYEDRRRQLLAEGLSRQDIADRLHGDSLTLDVIKQWRVVHFPIALAFVVLAVGHIVAVLLFWGWK